MSCRFFIGNIFIGLVLITKTTKTSLNLITTFCCNLA